MMRNFRIRTIRTFALALLVGALAPAAAIAQDGVPWRLSYFPYLTASPNDGVMGIARAIWFKQAGWGGRVTLDEYLAIEAGYSTRDAWRANVTYGAPSLSDDWRLVAHAEVGHEPNFGDADHQFGARLIRDRQLAWVDVTRRIRGPLHVAIRPAIQRTSLETQFQNTGLTREETDLSVRGALVLDTRDREFEENSGGLVELGAIVGTGGGEGHGYAAPYLHARGWVHPYLPLRLTGRLAWRGTTGSAALAPAYEFPGWEESFTMLGGQRSQRGLPIGATAVDGVILAGAEARFDLINIGEIGAVTLVGFVDGSKPLFGDDDFPQQASLMSAGTGTGLAGSSDEWTWAAGGGIAIRVLRAATLTVTAARANQNTRWYVGSGWSW